MLNNNYLTFGNSIMQKYSGMISRINPLALVFLQDEEKEEQTTERPVQITNVRNYFNHTSYHMYNSVVNRYIHNYNQIVSILGCNTIYAESPNFKMDIHPVMLSHTTVLTTEETEAIAKQITERLLQEYMRVDRIQDKTTEITVRQLTEGITFDSLKILPLKTREKIVTAIEKEVQEKVLPAVKKEVQEKALPAIHEQIDHTVLTKDITRLLQKSVNAVVEQQMGNLPEPVVAETAVKLTGELSVRLIRELEKKSVQTGSTTEHIIEKQIEKQTEKHTEKQTEKQVIKHREDINNMLVRQIEPYIMTLAPGISRSVIRHEIWKICQNEETVDILMRELQSVAVSTEHNTNTIHMQKAIQALIHKIATHSDTCRKGKESYARQIVNRLVPLPVRPVHLEFRQEMSGTREGIVDGGHMQEQSGDKQPGSIVQHRVVKIYKSEQTTESRYYKHFIDNFIAKTREQRITEVDRSALPAGIIYHQKPKETVRFLTSDVIRLPLEMLNQPAISSVQDQTLKNEIAVRVLDDIENSEYHYPEHTQRRVIHRSVPDFKAQLHTDSRQTIIFSQGKESIITYNQKTPELAMLVQKTPESTMLVQERPEPAMSVQEKPEPVAGMIPIGLIHKQEEKRKEEHEREKQDSLQNQTGTATVQPDIIFTQEVVTRENIEQVVTEQIQAKQQTMATGQSQGNGIGQSFPGQSMSGQSLQGPVIMGQSVMGQSVMGQAGGMPDPGVERMISESVSRHLDKNVKEISRQVYQTLARQIKKEQERRGL